ncbi:hypothetical protein OpiT1DRAFT_05728 [Opitutaceae bacterium TAV1]|nr:hypothetical protein OpiT1DRAFT_05728 [Opitutaceae bacterium TAV1]
MNPGRKTDTITMIMIPLHKTETSGRHDRSRLRTVPVLAAAALLTFSPLATLGDSSEWSGGDGNWNEESNWSEGFGTGNGLILNGATVTITGKLSNSNGFPHLYVTNGSGLRLVGVSYEESTIDVLNMEDAILYVEGSSTLNETDSYLTDTTITVAAGASLTFKRTTLQLTDSATLTIDGASAADGSGFIGVGGALTFSNFAALAINLDNFSAGDYSLLGAGSFVGITDEQLLSLIQVTGNSAANAQLYVSTDYGTELRVRISSVPEPAACAALAGLAILARVALSGRRRHG